MSSFGVFFSGAITRSVLRCVSASVWGSDPESLVDFLPMSAAPQASSGAKRLPEVHSARDPAHDPADHLRHLLKASTLCFWQRLVVCRSCKREVLVRICLPPCEGSCCYFLLLSDIFQHCLTIHHKTDLAAPHLIFLRFCHIQSATCSSSPRVHKPSCQCPWSECLVGDGCA